MYMYVRVLVYNVTSHKNLTNMVFLIPFSVRNTYIVQRNTCVTSQYVTLVKAWWTGQAYQQNGVGRLHKKPFFERIYKSARQEKYVMYISPNSL